MARSQGRLVRLIRLLEALQTGLVLSSAALAVECGVSRRTIFRDLATLQEAGVPVVLDHERQGYTLNSRGRLPLAELSLEEILSLLVVCQNLGDRESGLPFHQGARRAAARILQQLPPHLQARASETVDALVVRLDAHHEHAQDEAEPRYRLLMEGFIERRSVRIRYRSLFEQQTITTLLSPYRFVYSRRAWYVIGRSSVHRAVRTFHLGRIEGAELVDATYRIPARFSLERHLGLAWHLIREPNEKHEIVIRFAPLVATNVAEIRWHATQTTRWLDDGWLEWRGTVEGLREISWWILGYGKFAEVVSPQRLRDMIAEHAGEMLKQYATPAAPPAS